MFKMNSNSYGGYVPNKPLAQNFQIPKRGPGEFPNMQRFNQSGNVEYPNFSNTPNMGVRPFVSYPPPPPPPDEKNLSNYYDGFGNVPRGNSNFNSFGFGNNEPKKNFRSQNFDMYGQKKPFNNFQNDMGNADTQNIFPNAPNLYNRKNFGNEQNYNNFNNDQNSGMKRQQNKWGNNRNDSRNKPYPKKRKFERFTPIKEICPELDDKTLPKDYLALLDVEKCNLCSLDHSSVQMAKMHYFSKKHKKKMVKWLTEHAEKTGEPLHPRAQAAAEPKKTEDVEEDKDPKHFHCEACDLPLTGKLHADSHYSGRNHQLVVMGKKTPSGKGHYGPGGKWIRDKDSKADLEEPFGAAFHQNGSNAGTLSRYRCDVCNVSCTSQEQIDMHFAGQKHAKKIKLQNEEQSADKEVKVEKMETKDVTDISEYYCSICNVSSNSTMQYQQHLLSNKHLNKGKEVAEETKPSKMEVAPIENDAPAKTESDTSQLYCVTCKVFSNSTLQHQQHMLSKKHANKLKSLEEKEDGVKKGNDVEMKTA